MLGFSALVEEPCWVSVLWWRNRVGYQCSGRGTVLGISALVEEPCWVSVLW